MRESHVELRIAPQARAAGAEEIGRHAGIASCYDRERRVAAKPARIIHECTKAPGDIDRIGCEDHRLDAEDTLDLRLLIQRYQDLRPRVDNTDRALVGHDGAADHPSVGNEYLGLMLSVVPDM